MMTSCLPATLNEIASAIGKNKRTVELRAKKGRWEYTEMPTRGRYNKRFYALNDLPAAIREAIQTSRGNNQKTADSTDIDRASTFELTKELVTKFSVLFPLPVDSNHGITSFALWQCAIEDLPQADVIAAVNLLLLSMTRFPYPAELRTAVRTVQDVRAAQPSVNKEANHESTR